MKLTKRILVVLAAAALLVSSFAFVTSAEFTEDNIEDILEFYQNPRYFSEDFEGCTTDSVYSGNVSGNGFVSSKFTTNSATVKVDPANPANKVLSATNFADGKNYLGYSIVFDDGTGVNEMAEELVFTVRFLSEKKGAAEAPTFSVNLYGYNASGEPVGAGGLVSPLKFDFETGVVSYAKVNANDASKFDRMPIPDLSVKGNTWYTLVLLLNCNNGTYSFSLQEDGKDAYESSSIPFGEVEAINEVAVSFSSLPKNIGSVNYLDELDIYSGTFLRGDITRDVATAQALYDISEFINNNEISLKTQLRIAKVYEVIVASDYEPSYTADFTEKTVKELYAAAVAYIPEAYTRAFCDEAAAINAGRSYSRRMKQVALIESYIPLMNDEAFYNANIDKAFDVLKSNIATEADNLIKALDAEATEEKKAIEELVKSCNELIDAYKPGEALSVIEALSEKAYDYFDIVNCVYEAEPVIAENEDSALKVRTAKEKLAEEKLTLVTVERESVLFIEYMQDFDPSVRDYELIKEFCDRINSECSNRNNSYNYSMTPNVYQYSSAFEAFSEKREAIAYNVDTFQNAVSEMYKADAKFADVYKNYNIAKSVYNGGAIHPDVDVSTVSGLEADIEKYLAKESELNVIIEAGDYYVLLVNIASESTFYNTIKASLKSAEDYFTANSANILDEYPGVAEAKAEVEEIAKKLKALEEASAKYIAAVNEINPKASFQQYKKATAAARALAAEGAVVGIDGVAEANAKLSEYESEINRYEGNSKTLVDAVARLNNKELNLTLKERRELIIIAKTAKDGAHNECSGVTAAKSAIAELEAAYISEVKAANEAFSTVVSNSAALAPSVIGQAKYSAIVELVKLLVAPVSEQA